MYYVYFSDGAWELGGVGFQSFDEKSLALNFIENRLKTSYKPNIGNYILIEGEQLQIESAEVVVKVKVKE